MVVSVSLNIVNLVCFFYENKSCIYLLASFKYNMSCTGSGSALTSQRSTDLWGICFVVWSLLILSHSSEQPKAACRYALRSKVIFPGTYCIWNIGPTFPYRIDICRSCSDLVTLCKSQAQHSRNVWEWRDNLLCVVSLTIPQPLPGIYYMFNQLIYSQLRKVTQQLYRSLLS